VCGVRVDLTAGVAAGTLDAVASRHADAAADTGVVSATLLAQEEPVLEPDKGEAVTLPAPEVLDAVPADWPVLDGYVILAEEGRGSMGVVYRARQRGLGRLVALKMVLSGAHAGRQELARFRTEAESVARLQHPGIVQIYEIGEEKGRPFLSLEFVAGGSLASRLDGTPWPADRATRLIEGLARAMHVAHRRGIVHRDLKPHNVLLTEDGQPKIADFGLAKCLDSDRGQTQSGAIVGTPSYMAPEQASGNSRQVGPATDVYALGAILYELLTGQPPFRAATPLDTVLQVATREPVPPSRLRSKVPRDLETICLKCLHKEPAGRYATALDLAADCAAFLDGGPIQARPVGWLERTGRGVRRHWLAATLLAVLVPLFIGGAAGIIWQWNRLTTLQQQAKKTTPRGEIDTQLLEQKTETRALLGHDKMVTGLAFRPDGQLLATSSWDQTVRLWDPRAAKLVRILQGHQGFVECVAFRFDGKRLASAGGDGVVRLWDPMSGEELLRFEGHADVVHSIDFSPDGRHLASAGRDNLVKVWDADSGKEIFTLTGHTAPVLSVAFRPDGKWLASAGRDQTVRVWDAATGTHLATYKGHTGEISGVAFSPDGRLLASGSQDKTVKVWDELGNEVVTFRGHLQPIHGVAFSPDGRYIASANSRASGVKENGEEAGAVKVWEARTGREFFTLRGHTGPITGVCFSPDGRSLATSSRDKSVKIWLPAPLALTPAAAK
jgi:DNA-binding beta-propeller fold protein YncE